MTRRRLLVVIGFVWLLDGAVVVPAQEKASPPGKETRGRPFKYEAEDVVPKDKASEKRRDYAVLEATLNDLVNPGNPEHKYHIQHVGPGREVLVNNRTCKYDPLLDLSGESRSVDNTDVRRIPAALQEDFKRRNKGPVRSLADFQPANPDILVHDLEMEFKDADGFVDAFLEKYPRSWGYVWAYLPAYSKDGNTALVVFEGGPNGDHGLNWVYMLTRKGKRWDVEWRHCHLGE